MYTLTFLRSCSCTYNKWSFASFMLVPQPGLVKAYTQLATLTLVIKFKIHFMGG